MPEPLSSMTGYARAGGAIEGVTYACEVKSVNGRGLDLRLRLASGHDALEPELRRKISKAVSRGSVAFTLTLERESVGGDLVINRQALAMVLTALEMLSGEVEAAPATLDGILGIKGVLEQRETSLDETATAALQGAILKTADAALNDLLAARHQEGAELAEILLLRLDEMAALVAKAEANPARSREAVTERLRAQVAALTSAEPALSEERLAHEALVLATKADIREELDRLTAHIGAARNLIAEGGPCGRKLDFLSQEFNREANTFCSKSNAVEMTAIGLDLKAVIDQFREQVQNIE